MNHDIAAILSLSGQLLSLVSLAVGGRQLWRAAPQQHIRTAHVVATATATAHAVVLRDTSAMTVEERLTRLEQQAEARAEKAEKDHRALTAAIATTKRDASQEAAHTASAQVAELAQRAGWDAAGVQAALRTFVVTLGGLVLELIGTVFTGL